MDAVLILYSEDFHHFDCNLGLKFEVSDSYRLKYCFKSKNKEEKGFFCSLFVFVRLDSKKKVNSSFSFSGRGWLCSRFSKVFFFFFASFRLLFFLKKNSDPLQSQEKFFLQEPSQNPNVLQDKITLQIIFFEI